MLRFEKCSNIQDVSCKRTKPFPCNQKRRDKILLKWVGCIAHMHTYTKIFFKTLFLDSYEEEINRVIAYKIRLRNRTRKLAKNKNPMLVNLLEISDLSNFLTQNHFFASNPSISDNYFTNLRQTLLNTHIAV